VKQSALKTAKARPHKAAAVHGEQLWDDREKLARRHRRKPTVRVTRNGVVRVTRDVTSMRREALARKRRIT
jgi:hypothetical protein